MPILPSFSCCFKILTTTAITLAAAQESPNPQFETEIFDTSQVFRQDVCDRVSLVHNGTLDFKNALQNVEIRPLLLVDDSFISLDDGNTINEESPSIAIEIMDEACRLAGCTWRNSFAAVKQKTFQSKLSSPEFSDFGFTELFNWTTATYDITVTRATDLLERRKLGITFPEHWYESDIIMVAKRKEKSNNKQNFLRILFAWVAPFSIGVWALIAFTILSSGVIYWMMERLESNLDQRCSQKKYVSPVIHTFSAALAFTGHYEFRPRTHASRLFSFSLSFWALVIMATYTANLASFLLASAKPDPITVKGLEEAVQKGFHLCTTRGFASETVVMKDFPTATFIRRKSERATYEGVRENICDVAVTNRDGWRTYEKDVNFNPDCNLEWVGRTYLDRASGFATRSDPGSLCTSLVSEVFNLHLKSMKESGFIDQAWNRHQERLQEVGCQTQETGVEIDDPQDETLNLIDTGGVFMTHFILVGISFLMILVKRQGKRRPQTKTTTESSDISSKSLQNLSSGEKYMVSDINKKDEVAASSILASLHTQQEVVMEQNRKLTKQYEKLTKLMERNGTIAGSYDIFSESADEYVT